MGTIVVYYYSRTGNTEKMAKAVVEGIQSIRGVEVTVTFDVKPEELVQVDAVVIGMPTYHHDMTSTMKKLFEEIAVQGINLAGKIGATFGSYGWSGEAPKLIQEIMENKFEMRILKPPLLVKYAPNAQGLKECRELGRYIAEQVVET